MDAIAAELLAMFLDVLDRRRVITESDLKARGIPPLFAAEIAHDATSVANDGRAAALADQWALTIARAIDAAFAA